MKFNGYIFTNKEFILRLVQNFRNKSELFFGIACLSFFLRNTILLGEVT